MCNLVTMMADTDFCLQNSVLCGNPNGVILQGIILQKSKTDLMILALILLTVPRCFQLHVYMFIKHF